MLKSKSVHYETRPTGILGYVNDEPRYYLCSDKKQKVWNVYMIAETVGKRDE
jgi:hypothetical protein